ncbi:XRE family transcriptional regulator [Catellatospora citrea]|uniref:helix-turn-helix domain-containing protein n=1 Tax=Catellatospora citrea TaxID=53366 RepID=UPI0033EF2D72
MDALTTSRLILARKRRGLSLVKLAQVTGISARSLSAYENGHQQPSLDNLRALSKALAFPVSFFFAAELDEVPIEAISFRALSKTPAFRRDAARSAGRIALLLNDWIDERFVLPSPDVPHLPKTDPETAAEMVRARWGLGQAPIANMIHLLEAHGVRVYSLAAECADVDAFSTYRGKDPLVLLDVSKSGERIRFDSAHELGHLVLHSEHREPHGPDAEQEANRFAAAFLMPRADVLSHGLQGAMTDRIIVWKARWRVSAMALAHRLHEVELLTEWGYRSACVSLSRMGYRSTEPDGIQPETSQVLAKVFQAIRADGLSPAEIARELHLHLPELNRHVFGLIPTAIEGGATGDGDRRRARLTVVTS